MIFYPKCCLLIFLVYNFQTDLKKILSFLLLAKIQYFSLKKARLPCTRRARPCTTRTRFYLALEALEMSLMPATDIMNRSGVLDCTSLDVGF